ncbi:hypothetical protein [Deinococcus sp. NW-56]|uniref:hypothetical protein n=1 Tax=Deinococcus sp. NW-56 TaxID=2080419 RepID=UPI000CF43B1D|nr:hypothetical protein [Deinococcus sp. NW-56]
MEFTPTGLTVAVFDATDEDPGTWPLCKKEYTYVDFPRQLPMNGAMYGWPGFIGLARKTQPPAWFGVTSDDTSGWVSCLVHD